MAQQYLDKTGLSYFWNKLKSKFLSGNTGGVFYGTCSTAAGTVAKVVECADFTADNLKAGTIIVVTFTATNSGAVANLTMNVNGTGAKHIKYINNGTLGNLTSAAYLKANTEYPFYYDGANWVVWFNYNTTYSALSEVDMKAGTATASRLITAARLKEAVEYHAPVTSVNGSTGDVTVTVPTKTSDLTNDSGFITSAPVTSVNGSTGAVTINVPTATSELTNDSGFITDVGDSGTARTLYFIGSSEGSSADDEVSKHSAISGYVTANDAIGGEAKLVLGNSTLYHTAGSKRGIIRLYGQDDLYTDIQAHPAGSSSNIITLPNATGTLALSSSIPSSTSQLDNDSNFVTESAVTTAITTPIFYASDATVQYILSEGFFISSTVVVPSDITTLPLFLSYVDPRAWFCWMNGTEIEFARLSISVNTSNTQGTLYLRGRTSIATGIMGVDSSWTVTPLASDAEGVAY